MKFNEILLFNEGSFKVYISRLDFKKLVAHLKKKKDHCACVNP